MNLKSYIDSGKLKHIEPKNDQVKRLLKRAQKDISTAEHTLGIDDEWAYTIAFHSMLRAGRALLLHNGYRVSGEGQHKTVVEVSGILLGENFSELTDKFNRMRRTRSDFIYDYIELSLEESKVAIKNAKELILKIEKKTIK